MCLTTGSALQPQSQGGRRRCCGHPFGGWGSVLGALPESPACSEVGASEPTGKSGDQFSPDQREKRMATRGSAELLGERSRFSRILA